MTWRGQSWRRTCTLGCRQESSSIKSKGAMSSIIHIKPALGTAQCSYVYYYYYISNPSAGRLTYSVLRAISSARERGPCVCMCARRGGIVLFLLLSAHILSRSLCAGHINSIRRPNIPRALRFHVKKRRETSCTPPQLS